MPLKTAFAYAGIGARKTPASVLELMGNIAMQLADTGLTLRSGGADGADTAFELGSDMRGGQKEIYLPWPNFNGRQSPYCAPCKQAYELAASVHPRWRSLSHGARALQARNSHQVLGNHLDSKALFVLCWTEGGRGQGGTGQAIRLARRFDIHVFDLAVVDLNQLETDLTALIEGYRNQEN